MRIGFEQNILSGQRTGIGNYALSLISALAEGSEDLEFLGSTPTGWSPVDLARHGRCVSGEKRTWPYRQKTLNIMKNIPGARQIRHRLKVAGFYFPRKSKKIDLFHAFNYVPPAHMGRTTILPVVYDLSFIRYPDMHPTARLRALSTLPKIVSEAPFVHTISEFSKREIIEVLGYPSDQILVAYPAPGSIYSPVGLFDAQPVLEAYGLTQASFFLCVGTIEPRKNLKTVIAAYLRLSQTERSRFPLVIAGGSGWGVADFPDGTDRAVANGEIRFLGYVSDEALSALYSSTTVFLFPSVYEGFGMPVVEAMACGALVAHSKGTSMDEITGDLSIRLPALDVQAWSDVMEQAMAIDLPMSFDLQDMRIARAKEFTWIKSANAVREVYRQLETNLQGL